MIETRRRISFLQAHYNRFMREVGKHATYVAWNELDAKTASKLKAEYKRMRIAEQKGRRK